VRTSEGLRLENHPIGGGSCLGYQH
jgi:hypothetical protein